MQEFEANQHSEIKNGKAEIEQLRESISERDVQLLSIKEHVSSLEEKLNNESSSSLANDDELVKLRKNVDNQKKKIEKYRQYIETRMHPSGAMDVILRVSDEENNIWCLIRYY